MKLKLIAACVGLAFSAAAIAGSNIGVVDMQQIAQKSPETKTLSDSIKQKFSKRRDKIMKSQQQYQQDFQNMQKNQSVMTASKLKKAQAKLASEQKDLQQQQGSFQRDLYAAQNKAMADFLEKTQGAAKKVAAKKHLQLVIPRKAALYYGSGLDVTSDVLKQMD